MSNDKYDGWLVSPSILKRSLAVLGHYWLGHVMVIIPIFLALMCAGVLGSVVELSLPSWPSSRGPWGGRKPCSSPRPAWCARACRAGG